MADASLRIQQCKRLRKDNLDLSGLGLILIPQEAMSLVGITSLDLSGNKLSSLDARIGDLTNLTELNLEGNNLKYLPQELSNLKKLTHLNLKGNPLDGAFKSLLNADQNSLAGAISSCLRKHKQTLESNDFFDDIGWADDGPRKMTKIKGDDDDFDFDFDTDNSKIPTGGITKVSSEIKTGSKTRTHAASKQQDGGMKVASKTPLARGSRDGPSNKPNRGANDDFGMDDIMDSIATNKSRTNFSLADEDEVKLDELTILGKISQGGFSIVQKGIFRGTDVAIKRIFDPVITDKLREEIDNEVSVLSKIRHPNIVMMMAYSSTSPNLFIVFEMASRGALFDMLHKKKERLDEKLKCRIAYQTALALNYIHLSKVVHRDIKSHNILLDENYTVKLCDFGIARRMVIFFDFRAS